MKKILLLLFIILLSGCSFLKNDNNTLSNNKIYQSKQIILNSISTWWNIDWIMVSVSDPHIYSKSWPLAISGSYYFNPRTYYIYPSNLNLFQKAYYPGWDKYKVYYYDENAWAQAGLVVYVLRNIYHKQNVSLIESSFIKKNIKYKQKINPIISFNKFKNIPVTWWYIWTGKYLIVYNPNLIKFQTSDLLLYSSDIWTMKQDPFYKNSNWVNINSFYWSKLIDINWDLKSKEHIEKLIKPLQLDKYKRVFIYYPKYWYRSGVLALYLQENY
jgi:hypothetical protein